MYEPQQCFICRPLDSTVSEDAGFEPRTVATTEIAVRLYTTRLDLIHEKEKHGVRDPLPKLTITSPYVHSRVDSKLISTSSSHFSRFLYLFSQSLQKNCNFSE